MIKRLRPAYSDAELAAVYTATYDHTRWPDHVQRIAATIQFIHDATVPEERRRVADLSCGDGAIVRGLQGTESLYLGDYVPAAHLNAVGRIEDTVTRCPSVNLFILSETLEHVDDPADLLDSIRDISPRIVITTPLAEWDAGNPEHYWGWDEDGMRSVLASAGWRPERYQAWTPDVPHPYYTFQMWSASHA